MRFFIFSILSLMLVNSSIAPLYSSPQAEQQDTIKVKKKKEKKKKTQPAEDNTIQFLDFGPTPDSVKKTIFNKNIPIDAPIKAAVKAEEPKPLTLDYANYKSYGIVLPPNAKAITYQKDENGNLEGNIQSVDIKEIRNAKLSKEQRNYQYSMFYLNRGVVMINMEQYKDAVKYLNKSLKKDKNNKEAMLLRGNAYTETDEYRKALKDFNKAIKLDSSDAALFYNRANALIKINRYTEAMSDLTTAINIKNDYLYAYMGRASLRTLTKDYTGAIDDYTKVLDISQFYITARRGRGVTFAFMQQWDRAESDFELILERLPNDALSYYYLGLINIKQNDLISACNYLKKAEGLDLAAATEALKAYCK